MKVFMSLILSLLAFLTTTFGQMPNIQVLGSVSKNYYWTLPNTTMMTQSDALAFCANHGMRLASVKDGNQQTILNSIAQGKTLNGNQGYNFWICATYRAQEGVWRWEDNTLVEYSGWHSGWGPQPRNDTEFSCAFVSSTYWAGGGWFDHPCNGTMYPLCEQDRTDFYRPGV